LQHSAIFTPKMEAAWASETSVSCHIITRYNPEDRAPNSHQNGQWQTPRTYPSIQTKGYTDEECVQNVTLLSRKVFGSNLQRAEADKKREDWFQLALNSKKTPRFCFPPRSRTAITWSTLLT
jgi:hypothetical protein